LYLLKYSAGQWNTLVNFGAALLALSGQFSVGVNTPCGLTALLMAVLPGFYVEYETQRTAV
jgi:hypothetical protein